ncbi:MAG: MBG domain-containing protein, partial [Cyclobacteriaceae bacterium]
TYTISLSGGTATNYALTLQSGTLMITKATPVIIWPPPLPIKTGVPLSSTQLNAYAVDPSNAAVILSGTFDYSPQAGTILPAGSNQSLFVDFTPNNLNYNPVPATRVFITVNSKDNPIITWSNPIAITYGTALSSDQLNASSNVPGSFVYSPLIGTVLNSGVNQILSTTFTPTDQVAYNIVTVIVQLTVNKAPLTATAVNASKLYGQPNPSLVINYSGFVNGETPSAIAEPTIGTIATQLTGVGTVPITLIGGSASNYSITLQNGTLTISKATLTVKADDKSRAYGQSNPVNSLTYTGFVMGDGVTSITPPSINGPAATVLSAVGNYSITLIGGAATNYTLNLQQGSLAITKALLTATADDKSKIYGQTNPPLTITYSGFVNGEDVSIIGANPPIALTTASADSPTNTYPITVSGGLAANYDFTYVVGSLVVNKAVLTAKANDASRLYGAANPSFTLSYSGFVNGDGANAITTPPNASTIANAKSNVGSYPITVSGGSSANYSFLYQSGTLSVTKATLTATADNKSRIFGIANPTLTISYTGFLNGENILAIDTPPIASTTAIASSPLDSYPITVSGGIDNNYDFNYAAGALLITSSKPPTIKNFVVPTAEDTPFIFNNSTFTNPTVFSSDPGDKIVNVKIVTTPTRGKLYSLGNQVASGNTIKVVNGVLEDIKYIPDTNYNGPDNFTWNIFNGVFSAVADAQASINVTPVNDPPILSDLETIPLNYSPGDPPKKITEKLILNDIDNSFMFSATITITENKSSGDELELLSSIDNQKIKPSFDKVKGQLTLLGKDSKSNYESALKNVLFSSSVSSNTELQSKIISIVVNDSVANSNAVTRTIQITEVFLDLDIFNSFTPNNDGVNDVWYFERLKAYSQIAISVFDRNGAKVFDCTTNDCKWDGKVGGKELPSGPYMYTIDLNGGKRKYQGTVTILR